MANFTTHIAVGTVASGALATVTLAADVVGPESLVAVTLAGVLGSILPDIDLKDSRPSKLLFSGLGILFSFAVLFTYAMSYSIAELWILWLGTLVFIRYGLQSIFHRYAVHRGVWHSLLAGVLCAGITAIFFNRVLHLHEGVAWLAAGFLLAGYIVHLVLDELYSVDVMDRRIKASFGTALKIFDSRYPASSAAMLLATALVIAVAPPTKTFVEGVSSHSMWAGLQQRLLPAHKWFGLIGRDGSLAESAPAEPAPRRPLLPATAAAASSATSGAATSGMATGSITPQAGAR